MTVELLWPHAESPADWPDGLAEFLRLGDRPDCRVSWWIEPRFFYGGDTLHIDRACSKLPALRVPPGAWVHYDGSWYVLGRAPGGTR